jgi:hypothetical protein
MGHVRRVAAGLLVLTVLAACSAPPPSKAIPCGVPTQLVPYPASPELMGAPIGPLLIRGPYPAGAKDATALGFVRGRPFKMIVLVARDMDTDIALTGVRCSDGQPLRFWLNKGGGGIFPGGPASTPVPDDVMATTGDLRAVLPKIDAVATSGSSGYGGYFLFPTAGRYRIEGFAGDRKIGEATLEISDRPYPADQ